MGGRCWEAKFAESGNGPARDTSALHLALFMSVTTVYPVLYYDIIVANTLTSILSILYYDITIINAQICFSYKVG